MLQLPAVEPSAAPWRARDLSEVAATLLADPPVGRPLVVAVDGRSAGGKSSLADRLVGQVAGAMVVHTDDVAWYESFFDWDTLLVEHVLAPVHRGEPVAWRPPAWQDRGRAGAIEVPAGASLLVVEGVGAGRRSLATWTDRTVWVQADVAEARRRGLTRDLAQRPDPREAERFWDEWDAQEVAFLADDRPWERADLVVCGTPETEPGPGRVLVGGRGR